MHQRRRVLNPRLLCAGPGRLCQALGIDYSLYGSPVTERPFELYLNTAVETLSGPRIGISKAMDLQWRFGLAGSFFFSRPFK